MVDKVAGAGEPVPDRFCRIGWWNLVSGLLIVQVTALALGQEAGPTDADKALDELRGRTTFDESDDRVLDAWIRGELAGLDADPADPERTKTFQQRCVAQITNSRNKPEFVARLADRVGIQFAARLADCDTLAPPAARAIASVLRQFGQTGVLDALEAGLKCQSRQDVRYLCAQGFGRLRDSIAVNPVLMERTLSILRAAGQAETSGAVAAQIYDALSFRSGDRLAETMAAMLDVVTARIDKRRTVPACDGGELVFLDFVTANRPPNRALTERLVGLLAVQLRLDVARLEQEGVDEYEKMRLLTSVEAGESLLTQLVGPPTAPSVRNALKKGDDVRMLEAKIELNKWIGTPNAPGVLNGQPWNVPVSAP